MRPSAALLPLAALVAASALSGCGGGVGTKPPRELPAADAANVLGAERTIGRACSGDTASRAGLPGAVKTLIDETRENPNRTYESGTTQRALVMYEFSSQLAGQLQQCGLGGGDASALAEAARQARASV